MCDEVERRGRVVLLCQLLMLSLELFRLPRNSPKLSLQNSWASDLQCARLHKPSAAATTPQGASATAKLVIRLCTSKLEQRTRAYYFTDRSKSRVQRR